MSCNACVSMAAMPAFAASSLPPAMPTVQSNATWTCKRNADFTRGRVFANAVVNGGGGGGTSVTTPLRSSMRWLVSGERGVRSVAVAPAAAAATPRDGDDKRVVGVAAGLLPLPAPADATPRSTGLSMDWDMAAMRWCCRAFHAAAAADTPGLPGLDDILRSKWYTMTSTPSLMHWHGPFWRQTRLVGVGRCGVVTLTVWWVAVHVGWRMAPMMRRQAHLRRVTPEEVHLSTTSAVDDVTRAQAAAIIDEVRAGGEAALVAVAVRLRDLASADEPYVMERPELERRFLELPVDQQHLLQRVAGRVKAFATAQRASIQVLDMAVPGGTAGHTVRTRV